MQVELAGDGIDRDVLQHRAPHFRGGVDLRLGLLRQLDDLGVAAALEIEDAVRRPAMFIVADEGARRIGRERGLAGAGQAEEHGAVAIGSDIGGAMHRHHALFRQQVVEDGEDRLLHLAGIMRAADEDEAVGEVERDDGFAARAVAGRIGLEARQVDDGEFRREAQALRRHDQQVLDEQRVPGTAR